MALLLALHACNNNPPAPTNTPLTKTTTKGPVTLTITADKPTLPLTERLNLTITLTTEPNVTIKPPALGSELGEFTITHHGDLIQQPEPNNENKLVHTQTHTLEAFTADTHTIPAITIDFTDNRNPANPTESSITSEQMDIEVTTESTTDEAETDPTQYRDIKDPVELPTPLNLRILYYALAAIAVLILATIAFVKLINRERKQKLPPPIPAHEWAFEQLRKLESAGLIQQGQIHEFYFRLSMIVREYIERRFNLNAPERTTEEFLEDMRTTDKLSQSHKSALSDFLAACDMVKYALYEPEAHEIDHAFTAAKDFVTQTVPTSVTPSERNAA